jgi:hypothetical protein
LVEAYWANKDKGAVNGTAYVFGPCGAIPYRVAGSFVNGVLTLNGPAPVVDWRICRILGYELNEHSHLVFWPSPAEQKLGPMVPAAPPPAEAPRSDWTKLPADLDQMMKHDPNPELDAALRANIAAIANLVVAIENKTIEWGEGMTVANRCKADLLGIIEQYKKTHDPALVPQYLAQLKSCNDAIVAVLNHKEPGQPRSDTRDCSIDAIDPGGAFRTSMKGLISNPAQVLQNVCQGQAGDADKRKPLYNSGFSTKEISETNTIELTDELVHRLPDILHGKGPTPSEEWRKSHGG